MHGVSGRKDNEERIIGLCVEADTVWWFGSRMFKKDVNLYALVRQEGLSYWFSDDRLIMVVIERLLEVRVLKGEGGDNVCQLLKGRLRVGLMC